VDTARQWQALQPLRGEFPALGSVLCLRREAPAGETPDGTSGLRLVDDWLTESEGAADSGVIAAAPDSLATLVYTSGTTGRPKGVMLSHRNLLWNAEAVLKGIPGYVEDIYLSFLPLSHAFERTVGYYLPIMASSCVAYARSVTSLGEDLANVRPTVLLSVPRVFEMAHLRLQRQLAAQGAAARALFAWTVALGWRRFEAA